MLKKVKAIVASGPYEGQAVTITRAGTTLCVRGLFVQGWLGKKKKPDLLIPITTLRIEYCSANEPRSPGSIAAGGMAGTLLGGPVVGILLASGLAAQRIKRDFVLLLYDTVGPEAGKLCLSSKNPKRFYQQLMEVVQ